MKMTAYKNLWQQEYKRRETNILKLIVDQAEKGYVYLPQHFCYRFEGVWGLGSCDCIHKSLKKLIARSEVKFNQDYFKQQGLRVPNKYGALCVDGMTMLFKTKDPETGEMHFDRRPLFATHYQDTMGRIIPVTAPHNTSRQGA